MTETVLHPSITITTLPNGRKIIKVKDEAIRSFLETLAKEAGLEDHYLAITKSFTNGVAIGADNSRLEIMGVFVERKEAGA